MSVHAYPSTCHGHRGPVKASAQNLERWEPGPCGPEREACSLPAAPQFPPRRAEVFLHHLWNQAPDPVPSPPGRLPSLRSPAPLCQLGWPPGTALGGRKCWSISRWGRAPWIPESHCLSGPPSKVQTPNCSTYRVTTSWAGGQRLHPVPGRPVVPGRGVASICHHTPHRWPEPCLCSQSWLLRGPSEQGPEPAAWEQTDFSSLPQSQPGLSLH